MNKADSRGQGQRLFSALLVFAFRRGGKNAKTPRMIQNLQELIDNFGFFDDWEQRYAYLIDLGKALPGLPEAEKTDDRLVRGCTSRVWLVMDWTGGALRLRADSDAHIVRGLVAVVTAAYNGKTAQEVLDIDMEDIFRQLGLEGHLSPSRRNGFFSMIETIRAAARAAA